ncbi:MAG: uracil-DNA glycosylase [Acidobacteria bacterium]|jgi:DNA polymerase|nr:uracil-DNA glycosylase [Acidobacteriota bacterium]
MNGLRAILKFYAEMGAEFLHLPGSDPRADLAELNREILQCRRCRLHETKTHYVPGEGSNRPDIVFVGEAPGETEDQFGRPFIGKAGQLLDKIIQKMGLSRDTVFIGNVVKCRPPNNREPLKDEVEFCLPFLQRQIAILRPRVIVCLGKVALNNMLGTSHSMGRIRGQLLSFNGIPLVPTYHPAFILHKKDKEEISKAKWEVWEDMQKVLALLPGKRP